MFPIKIKYSKRYRNWSITCKDIPGFFYWFHDGSWRTGIKNNKEIWHRRYHLGLGPIEIQFWIRAKK